VSALSGQEGGGEAAFPADFTYMDVCVEDAEDQARWNTNNTVAYHTARTQSRTGTLARIWNNKFFHQVWSFLLFEQEMQSE
jgi:hypothetical protein